MKREESEDKAARILSMYTKLKDGKILNKFQEAERYGVTERSIQRDIDDIRCFLQSCVTSSGEIQEIVFDRQVNGYRLQSRIPKQLTEKEILAVCKVMLESRSLVKEEMFSIINKMINLCPDENTEREVKILVANEMYHYLEVHHGKRLLDNLWMLEMAVREQKYVKIRYQKLKDKKVVERKVKPVGVMFSEFYFYLTAFIEDIDKEKEFQNPDDLNPTIYRIDRLEGFEVLDEHFSVTYRERFEEGEFRKRVQFMYGGKLEKVKFKYSGPSIEAVLDRLPTAKILEEKDGIYIVAAEAFGKGMDMWLRSQRNNIEVFE